MLEKLSWKALLAELVLVIVVALCLTIFTHALSWSLVVTLTGLILWHYRQLLRLSHWLWVDRSMSPPSGRSSWEPLFHGISLLQKRNKKRRRELRNLIQRFRSGVESLPDGLILITDDGTIFWCNRLAQEYFGLRWPEDSGQNIQNLLRYPEFFNYLAKREFTWPLTLQLNHGQHMELRIMSYSEGQWLIVARDMTQLRTLENMRRNFFANVSHELRTPLTVLQGYLEMLEQDDLPVPARKKMINTMQAQSLRMSSLVEQLLTLSRIEAAPSAEKRQWVDVPQMLASLEQAAIALSEGKHRLCFNVDNELKVFGHQEALHSAISNLIFNAINHTPAGTEITVNWLAYLQGAKFSVEDNGPGIDAIHIPRLTERFYRADESRNRKSGGSGLGLAIVKHALSQHGSRLSIESQPYQKTTFSFTLTKQWLTSGEQVISNHVSSDKQDG